jgi:hypothetical protein
MRSWTHAITFGLFWALCVFPAVAGKRPQDSLRKILFSTLLVGLVVGLVDGFGWRAFAIPMVFITVPCAAVSFYLVWSTKLKALAKERESDGMSNSVFRRRTLSRELVIAALLIWLAFFYSTHYCQNTRPTVSDEQSGRIYPLSEHGHIVYLTLGEQCGLFSLVFVAVGCFVSGYVVERRLQSAIADSKQNGPKT